MNLCDVKKIEPGAKDVKGAAGKKKPPSAIAAVS
jgi:hypothetical protein